MAVKRYDGTNWQTVAGAGSTGAAGIVTSATAPSDTSVLWADTTVTTNNALIPAGGTTGQVLSKTSSSDYAASWSTPAGGKVLQVVQGDYASQTSSSSSTYADTNLTATITPSSATSKILVMYGISWRKTSGAADNAVNFRLFRNATNISQRTSMGYNGSAIFNYGYVGSNILDTPATTSAITYKVQFASDNNTASVSVHGSADISTIILMEIGA